MTDLLVRNVTSERNYLIIPQFNKIIPYHKKETSVERKKIKIIENNDLTKKGNTKIYNIVNNNNIKNKSLINNYKKINNQNNNIIKSNNDNNYYKDINSKSEKKNDIINVKENNFTDINVILHKNDNSKTFNRYLSTKNIKIGKNIIKNKSNQIINNSKIKIERNKDEIFRKKLNNENNNKTADTKKEGIIKKNSKQIFESKLNKNNIKRNTDGIIHIGNQKIIFNENLKKIKDRANKVKIKLNNKIDRDVLNNFNYTINPKSNNLCSEINLENNSNIIFNSNSVKNNSSKIPIANNNNKINNLEGPLRKRKNIDINTEYQTNPDNNTFSPEKNIFIDNMNNTTSKVKLKTNNFITNIEMDKDKEFFNLTENSTILKTKSNAKKKLENKKDDPEIEIRIINRNEKIIFNNKRIPLNNKLNSKNDEIYNNNLTEENKKINNNEKCKNKNNNVKSKCVKIKKNQIQNDSINRNNTYNNNESSFFTININNSILDEINNESKHNLGNYNFVNKANNNIDSFNINNLFKGSNQKNLDNNINNKINTIKVFKSNSNTNKNIMFQNFHIFNDNKNSNYNITTNNYSNCNTGNTTNNILNPNNSSNINNNINNFINNKIKTERENIELSSKKMESKNNKELDNKDELILIELDDEKDPKDTDEIINNIENKNEIMKSESLNKKIIEELKDKDISLDKSTSLRVYPVFPEDFIEKDDEVIKLLNTKISKDNNEKKLSNNNISQKNEEEESEIIIQNSEFSIMNDFSKFNYNINNKNIYQNQNIYMNYNNSNNHNINNNPNINLENITMKDTSIISNFGIKGCKSITQAGKERTGHRKKNQDNYIIEKNINNLLGFNLFAILDGHGENGHIVSQLASKYLIKKFTNISKEYNDIEKLYDFLKKSDFQKIIDIFLEIDKEIINQKNFDISLSGTTCVLVIQLGEHLICSNIGDSRAILIYEENNINKIFELSHDSKPDIPEEEKRINLMGGRVDKVVDENGEKTGPYRVYIKDKDQPGLAMSRSFGDKKAKSCGVIPYPDIIEYNLNNNECKYMVLCSDGVWEFLSNEEVMEIGNKYYSKNNMTEFCNELLKKSTEMWKYEENYMDDITIVTVFF